MKRITRGRCCRVGVLCSGRDRRPSARGVVKLTLALLGTWVERAMTLALESMSNKRDSGRPRTIGSALVAHIGP